MGCALAVGEAQDGDDLKLIARVPDASLPATERRAPMAVRSMTLMDLLLCHACFYGWGLGGGGWTERKMVRWGPGVAGRVARPGRRLV